MNSFTLIELVLMSSITYVKSKTFLPTTHCQNVAVCSVDSPTVVVQINQSASCIPSSVQCGFQCKRSPNCTNYNFKATNNTCELFSNRSFNFNVIQGCVHFEVNFIVRLEDIIEMNECITQWVSMAFS